MSCAWLAQACNLCVGSLVQISLSALMVLKMIMLICIHTQPHHREILDVCLPYCVQVDYMCKKWRRTHTVESDIQSRSEKEAWRGKHITGLLLIDQSHSCFERGHVGATFAAAMTYNCTLCRGKTQAKQKVVFWWISYLKTPFMFWESNSWVRFQVTAEFSAYDIKLLPAETEWS